MPAGDEPASATERRGIAESRRSGVWFLWTSEGGGVLERR